MEIRIDTATAPDHETPLLALILLEGESELAAGVAALDQRLGGAITSLLARGDFKGKEGQTQLLYPAAGAALPDRVLLVGAGRRAELSAERVRRAAGHAVKQAIRVRVEEAALLVELDTLTGPALSVERLAQALAEGAVLASYQFDEMKSRDPETVTTPPRELVLRTTSADGLQDGVRVGSAAGRGANLARRLGNLPGNVATPTFLAETARDIAARHGMKATILGPAELEAEGMHALLAVAQGSDQEPRLIVLEHRQGATDQAPLVLLGKGLTFDSGGISIKPAASMEEMKFDMCGGAAVLGAMDAIGALGLPVNVIGVVPSSENLLSGSAMKPGDILRSHLGKTIEVINTDAEGRLILADALSYLRRFEPAAVVDAATLTGACVIALGHHASGALGNDEALLREVQEAGEQAGERVWPLPMFDEYREQIKSDYADIKNSGGRAAGTVTAAWFLREFVGEFPWVHLDIAGTAWGDGKLSYLTKGATGAPTRLFVEWVRSRAG